MVQLAPSIIAADFSALGAALEAVAPYASSWHVDVMDGHYVPNLTIGPMIVETIARLSPLRQDVHLMVTNPDASWEWYAKAGARRIAFHPDQSPDPAALLDAIRMSGIGPGLAVNPEVGIEEIADLLPHVDHLVVMSVHPGFAGQAFISDVLPKLTELRRRCPELDLYIDGGVSPATAPLCVEAGANWLVSASAVFGAPDPARVAASLAGLGR